MNSCLKPVRVLLVDHYPIFLDGMQHALSNTEFTVVGQATNGKSAIDLAHQLLPELILLDLFQPEIAGLEVLCRLLEVRPFPHVLIFTAQITQEQMIEALQLGARGVVLKDVGVDLLLRSMRAVVSEQYWVGRQTIATVVDVLRHRAPASSITLRERQIIELVLSGLTNREIGTKLGISEETVKRHISNLYDKLGVSSRMELALRVTR